LTLDSLSHIYTRTHAHAHTRTDKSWLHTADGESAAHSSERKVALAKVDAVGADGVDAVSAVDAVVAVGAVRADEGEKDGRRDEAVGKEGEGEKDRAVAGVESGGMDKGEESVGVGAGDKGKAPSAWALNGTAGGGVAAVAVEGEVVVVGGVGGVGGQEGAVGAAEAIKEGFVPPLQYNIAKAGTISHQQVLPFSFRVYG